VRTDEDLLASANRTYALRQVLLGLLVEASPLTPEEASAVLVETWNALLHSDVHRDLLINASLDDLLINASLDDLLRLRGWLAQHMSETTGYPVDAITQRVSVGLTMQRDHSSQTSDSATPHQLGT
jgi:hypothetical protein